MTKTGSRMILIGTVILLVGFCFIPAAFGDNPDKTMLGAGLSIAATGALLVAVGIYMKAVSLTGSAQSNQAPASKRTRKSNCDSCGKEEPAVQCRVHQIHLCADCLAKHYDFRSCAYIPSTRRSAAAHAAGA
jgi:hypothetical protein